MLDSIIFLSSILMCLSQGSYYKQIQDVNMKKNYGTGLGILVALLICGHHIYHSVLMVWDLTRFRVVTVALLAFATSKILLMYCLTYVHRMSLAYTWIYLFYIHLNLTGTYIIWLYQTLALRLVGLAFEMRNVETPNVELKAATSSIMDDTYNTVIQPTAVDIISYAYYFIGLHKGPYYRWRTFHDHFKIPFGIIGDCRDITEQNLKRALICALGYTLLRMKYPPQAYYDKEFYTKYGTDYLYLYNIPQLLMHLLYLQYITLLCTSVCTESGFGVYPAKSQPLPGHGPTNRFSVLKFAADIPDGATDREYSYTMLKCFENDKLLLGPKMKDTMRSWDMPTRYWFGTYVYKNILSSNKEVRSAFSFFLYTMWFSPSLSQFIVASTLWVYLHLEAEYCKLYKSCDSLKVPWNIGYSIMRIFCLLYLTPCFVIEDAATVLKYYNSIFWVYHIVMLFLILLSVIIYKSRAQI